MKWDAARLIKALTNAGDGKRGMDRMLYEINTDIDRLLAEVDARDEVITKLLEMLKPGGKPDYPDARHAVWKHMRSIHARACEIAGRTE